MEDNLFSCSCPKCRNSLLEAALFNPLYFFESQCPFCAAPIHWARSSVAMIIAGISFLGTGGYYLGAIAELPEELSSVPAILVALGVASFLFGLITFRLVAKKSIIKKSPKATPNMQEQNKGHKIEGYQIEGY